MSRWWLRCAPLLVAVTLTGCADSRLEDLRQYAERVRLSTVGEPVRPFPRLEPYQGFAYAAYSLRDPFESPSFLQETPPVRSDGLEPNLDRPTEPLESYSLESLEMVGVMEKNGMWALVLAPDGVVHRVAVGNHMGTNHGRIVKIAGRSIELVEIVPDGYGGWKERDAKLSLTP